MGVWEYGILYLQLVTIDSKQLKIMFKNYLKTSFSILSGTKKLQLHRIFGLALGTLCCVYIILYVADQYNYDKQQTD